ncbi:MAG: MBL fold metallo-hydrolase [Spirochaetota bacterium]|nr:MAG: MBL fold metallo-hydrolase [Spirochaetota bacterium]
MSKKTKFEYFGNAAYRITNTKGKVILIDPFLNESDVSPVRVKDLDQVDLILVTHAAWDHLGDTVEIALKFKCPICCGGEVRHHLIKHGVDQNTIRGMCWGLQVVEAGIRVRSVTSMHWSFLEYPDGTFISGPPMGFIFYPDPGVRVWHSGDTAIFSDLKMFGELYQPNIALVSCSMPQSGQLQKHGIPEEFCGEMSPHEAALACLWMGVEYALGNHYSYAKDNKDVEKFVTLLNNLHSDEGPVVTPVILEAGDVWYYPPED